MTLRLLVLLLRRELRGSASRVAFFVACLLVGVAAVVAVAGLADSVQGAMQREARPLLAADVALTSRRPLPDTIDKAPQELISGEARLQVFTTMASVPGGDSTAAAKSLLVELKAVSGGYPFYGSLELDPPGELSSLLQDNTVLVEPGLLSRLGLQRGDALRIGSADFQIAGEVLAEPDRVQASLAPGPRVMLSPGALERSGLASTTGRMQWKALYQTPDMAAATELAAWFERQEEIAAWTRVETWTEGNPGLQRGLERAETFLGLVALLSLLVGGAGVAQVIRAWLARRFDAVAVYRCLGLRPAEVGRVFLAQTLLLGLIGSAVGAVAGTACLLAVPVLLGDLLPAGAVDPWQPLAILQGILLGTGIAVLFAWAPLRRAQTVPPIRVLRRTVEPLPLSPGRRVAGGLLLLVALVGVSVLQAGAPKAGLLFSGVVGLVVLVLGLSADRIARLLARLGENRDRWLPRHALRALARPGAGTLPAMVALALGVVVVLGTWLLQERVTSQLGDAFPPTAPDAFLIDVQGDQWDGVRTLVEAHDASRLQSAPMVMGRLAGINADSTEDLVAELDDEQRWAYTREQRLGLRSSVPSHNTVVEGAFASIPDVDEVSLEQRYAQRLGVGLGDTVSFDIQGLKVPLRVSSIREVQWESMEMNFFLLVEPGVLDDAPHTRLVTFQIPPDQEDALQTALAVDHPNITLISVRKLRDRARGILERLALAIRALGGFTAVAGVVILFASVGATTAQRAREVALLKTLGVTRAGAAAMLALEHALVGGVAGVVGVFGAGLLTWGVQTQLMRLSWEPALGASLVAVLATSLGAAVAGTVGNLNALQVAPQQSIREG
jgi:putative ABC transport system permease protein